MCNQIKGYFTGINTEEQPRASESSRLSLFRMQALWDCNESKTLGKTVLR